MSWDFSTEPEFEAKLEWMRAFVRDEIEPLALLLPDHAFLPPTPEVRAVIDPLKARVREQGLWACHLGPDLGGPGYGQVKLALMHEILGREVSWAPVIFGCHAPDSGNAEILAHYGTAEQRHRFLRPLLDGDIFSCFSMTEPHAGADPLLFTTMATRDGDDWVIDGWKFFSSHVPQAAFIIVMAVTDPDAEPYRRMSMFLVEQGAPGVDVVRRTGLYGEPVGGGAHGLVHYAKVRVPADHLLGRVGDGFAIAQTRLGGGRVHHAMRVVGACQRSLDMMCERALSRRTRDGRLADLQAVQHQIADAYAALAPFRLLVLFTAWQIDNGSTAAARRDIATIKVLTPKVLSDVVSRAIQIHGALGCSNELPLMHEWMGIPLYGVVDGPTEVHKTTVARQLLRDYEPVDDVWPSEHIPARLVAAREKFGEHLEHAGSDPSEPR